MPAPVCSCRPKWNFTTSSDPIPQTTVQLLAVVLIVWHSIIPPQPLDFIHLNMYIEILSSNAKMLPPLGKTWQLLNGAEQHYIIGQEVNTLPNQSSMMKTECSSPNWNLARTLLVSKSCERFHGIFKTSSSQEDLFSTSTSLNQGQMEIKLEPDPANTLNMCLTLSTSVVPLKMGVYKCIKLTTCLRFLLHWCPSL